MTEKKLAPNINFLSIIFIIGGLLVAFPSFKTVCLIQASRTWPQVEGQIISSVIERRWLPLTDRYGQEYFPRIWFAYQVNGKKYISCNLHFAQDFLKDRQSVDEIMKRYPTGQDVLVFYDPKDYENAVIESNNVPEVDCVLVGIGLFAILAGVVALFGAVFRSPENDTV